MMSNKNHIPVLLKEVVDTLEVQKGEKYIDATLGFGGHTSEILAHKGQVLSIEWDPVVLDKTKKLLTHCPKAYWKPVLGNFADIAKIAEDNKFGKVSGILFDLGISTWHFKEAKRGFSFTDSSLDMRISPEIQTTALEVINKGSYDQLYQIFTKVVQEELSGPIAGALVRARGIKKIESAKDLAEIIEKVYRQKGVKKRLNPATKVFLALRTVVNLELENLKRGIEQSVDLLKAGGKVLVITFNSNEDRIVKNFFREKAKEEVFTKQSVLYPSREEIRANPLSRSAKLRFAIKK